MQEYYQAQFLEEIQLKLHNQNLRDITELFRQGQINLKEALKASRLDADIFIALFAGLSSQRSQSSGTSHPATSVLTHTQSHMIKTHVSPKSIPSPTRRTVLITGGSGFIGSHLVRYWMRSYPDDLVVNIDKLSYASGVLPDDTLASHPHYTFVHGDISDPKVLDKVFSKGVDIVIHLAAETHVDRSVYGPKAFIESNVLGTFELLEAARKYGVQRFHHVSTDEVFGTLEKNAQPWTESSPYNPRSPYSASKAASDHLVRSWFTTFHIPVSITNCSNNIGIGMFPEKFIPLAITNILEGKAIPIYGDGAQSREWLHVEDHCLAIDMVIHRGKVGETYFVGPEGHSATNLEIAKMILEKMGKGEDSLHFVADRPGHDRHYYISSEKIRRELGWRPQHTLHATLDEMIEWYTHNVGRWSDKKKTARVQEISHEVSQDRVLSPQDAHTIHMNTNISSPVRPFKKVLLFGKGQFAGLFDEYFSTRGVGIEYARDVDIRDYDAVKRVVAAAMPDVVINTAAKTNLDWCEQNQGECFDVNTLGADTVARVCQEADVYLLHISTGCIQASTTAEQAHKETDPASPTSFYSWTKFWADQMLENRIRQGARILILRPRQPVSAVASPRNALTKLLTFKKFIDTPNSVTVLEDFLKVADQLLQKGVTGVYNVANPGVTSPYKMALLLKEIVDPQMEFIKISKDELNAMTLAKRIDSVLDCSKLAAEGVELVDIDTRLRQLLIDFKHNLTLHPEALKQTQEETAHKLSLV